MIKITVKVEGMMCGMCEAHVNDAVRRALPVKKVTSNHRRGETVILSQADIGDDRIAAAIKESGYDFKGVTREAVKANGFLGLLRK